MQKKLHFLLFCLALLAVPWATRAQDVSAYRLDTGVDSTMWIPLTSSATHISAIEGEDDEYSELINIGFTFMFGGESYTQFSCNSNGRMRLGSVCSHYWLQPFTTLTNATYNDLPFITAFGMDNTLEGSGAHVMYELVGTAPNRILVIEYFTPSEYDMDGDLVRYQIQLHEDSSRVRLVYGTTDASYYDTYQIGLAGTATDYLMISPSTHSVNNANTNTTYSVWPGEYRYYELTPVIPSCPRPHHLVATVNDNGSVSLTWSPNGDETSWLFSYGTTDTILMDTSITLSNLQPNTRYTFSVRALCAPGDTSSAATTLLTTPCGLMTTMPFMEGFEYAPTGGSTTNTFVDCWTRLNNGTSYYGYPYVSSSTSYCHSGSQGLYWYNSTTTGTYGDYQCIVLPPVDGSVISVNTLQLSFWAKSTSTSYNPTLLVGVMTDPSDISTFQSVGTVNMSNSTAWNQYSVDLNTYTGTGEYIAIRANRPSSSWYIALDDVAVDFIPTCPAVEDLVARAVTTSTAIIEWDEQDTATAWTIEYGPMGFALGTGTTVISSTDTFTLTGLDGNTDYDVYVSPVCADNHAGRAYVSFRTACTFLDTLPYMESFETCSTGSSTSTTFVDCWYRHNNGTSYFGYPYVSSSSLYAHGSGSRGLYWYNTTTMGTYGDYQCIVMPAADPTLYPINTLQISFWARSSSSSYSPTFQVGIMTDPTDYSTFQQVATVNVGNSTSWQEYITTFEDYTGTGCYPAIRALRSSSSWYCYLDEFKLEVAPDCPHVQNLAASHITRTSALISWDEEGSATSWNVEYGTHGFTRGTGITVTATADTLTLSGLNSSTTYDVYVTPACTGLTSESFMQFTTLCDLIDTLPLFEDFESAPIGSTYSNNFLPCWSHLNNGTMYCGYPYVSSSSSYSHNGGTRGLYWYNTTTTATYGDYQYVVLPGVDPDYQAINTLQLKFWAKASSTSYHPTFDIGVMTDPNDPATFQTVSTSTVGADWEEVYTAFDSYTGDGNYVAIRALRPTTSWYAYVDEITLELSDPCANVYALNTDNVGYIGATVSWNTRGGTEDIYNFDLVLQSLDSTNSGTIVTETSTDRFFAFTGLTPGTHYKVLVRANCGNDQGNWDSILFTTLNLPCAVLDSTTMDTIMFSNGTSTSTSGILVYSSYGNTICQTIYTAEELLGSGLTAGPIIGVDLGFSNNSSYAKEFSIMMANTTKSTFSSSSDMENMAHHTLTYGPQAHPLNTSGWQHYDFETPFQWDGTSNIIMTTFMNQPAGVSQSTSSFYGYSTPANATRTAYRYQDSQPFTDHNYTGGYGSTSTSRPSIHFYTGECVEYASCMPSIAWISSNDSNGVELSWLAAYMEDTWNIDYREIDSTEWHNIVENVSDNSYLIQGLEDATRYQIRLSHYCVDSLYETIVEVMTPGMYVMPQDGGDDTLYACRTIIYDDGGPDGSYSNYYDGSVVIFPTDSTQTLRISGTFVGEGCCDYLGIYDGVGSSRRTLFYGTCTSSGQAMQIGPFTSESGALTVTFHSDVSNVYSGFELRTQCIPVPHCADIRSVVAETVGTQAANIKWRYNINSNYGDPDAFEYICYDSLHTEIAHDTTSQLSHFFTNLNPDSYYTVMVRTLCPGDEQYGPWDSVSFSTIGLPCVESDTSYTRSVMFSNETNTSTGVFITSAWGNSFCQSIFTATELSEAGLSGGQIKGVTLGYNSTSSYNKDFTILLTTTSNSNFSSSSNYVTIDSSMIVYGPAAHATSVSGWVTYTFDTAFYWDGSSNLVLTTTMNQPAGSSQSSSGFLAYATDCGTTRTIYRYRDSSPWTTGNYTSGNSGISTYRPSVTFLASGCAATGTCAAPTVIVDSIGYDHVGIQWAPGYYETSWQVAYRQSSDSTWVDLGSTSSTSMNITGLNGDMDYLFRVTALCGDTNISRTISVHTICMPTQLPLFEDFESWSTSTTTPPPACWARFSNYSSGTYPYASSSYSVYPGSHALYFYAYNNTNSAIILPYFDAPIDSINLSFQLMRTNTSYSHALNVGVMTDPNDFETFVPVAQAVPTSTYVFEPFEFTFEDYTGNGKYIAIATSNIDNYCYPYLDNIEVNYISSCRRVSGVNLIGATLTTATIGWDTTDAPTYDVEYGPVGYTRGTGTRITGISADNVTITGLTPGTEYDFYVRGNCTYDSSLWSFTYTFVTECLLIDSLPFHDDLETWRTGNTQIPYLHTCWTRLTDATTYYYPYLSNSSTYSHGGGSHGLYWYRSNSTGSYGSYNGIVLPGIDTTVIPMDTLELSFWARNSSSSYTTRLIVGILTDPSDYSTFTPVDTTTLTGSDWTNIFVPFNNYTGYGNYIGIVTAYDGSYYYAYVDDFDLHYTPPCMLFNLRKDTSVNSSDTRLAVRWDDNGAGEYQVVCTPIGMPIDSGIVITTSATNAVFNGLTPNAMYDIYARGICSVTDTGRWISITLQTDMCPSSEEVMIGSITSTSTSYNAPVNNFYRYTLSETIIDSSELTNMTTIEYLGYYYNYSSPSTQKTNCTIYFQPTNKTTFTSSSDLVLLDTTIATKVYTGNLNCSLGWNLFPLDTVYNLTGSGNLLIIVDDNSNAYDGSSYSFRTESTSGYKTLTWYSDTYNADPFSTSYSGSKTYYQYRPLMRLVSCVASCPMPYNVADTHDYHSATITWQGEGSNFEVNIKDSASAEWPSTDIAVYGNSSTFNGLLPATTYTFRVRQDCNADSLGYSDWVEYNFTTDSLDCYTPDSLHVTAVTNATATFDWVEEATSPYYDLHVWFTGGLDSVYRVSSHPVTVGGFMAGITYNATIRPLCGVDLIEGDWSDTISFTTATCPDVTGLTASNVTTNSVTLNWTADPMAQTWTIEYGFEGFDQGTGTTVVANTNSYVVTGLLDDTPYEFYVKANCGTDWTSENWVRVLATTQSGGVTCDAPTGVNATVADNAVTINWTASTGNISFEIEYGPRGFSHGAGTTTNATTAPAVISNLDYETQYDLYVRAICDLNTYSAYSNVVTFTTGQRPSEDCEPVSNLTVTEITDNTAHVAWTPAEGTDTWQIVVTDAQGANVADEVRTDSFFNLAGLTAGKDYTVKVRTVCGDDNFSAYVSTNFRTTGGVGISDVNTVSCTIYPNPTTSSTTISVSGVNGKVKIEVVDMNGRVVSSESLECSSDCAKTMDVDNLAQGAYFVRITADNTNMVRKLIVR